MFLINFCNRVDLNCIFICLFQTIVTFIGKVTNFVEFVKGCLGLNECIFDLFII